jgi:hypothetical protein
MDKNELICGKCHRSTICSNRWHGATCVCGAWLRNHDATAGPAPEEPAPTISVVQTTVKLQEKIRQFSNALNVQETLSMAIDLSTKNLQEVTYSVAKTLWRDRIRIAERELVEGSKKLVDLKLDLDALLQEQHPSCFQPGDQTAYLAVVPARKRDASPKRSKK